MSVSTLRHLSLLGLVAAATLFTPAGAAASGAAASPVGSGPAAQPSTGCGQAPSNLRFLDKLTVHRTPRPALVNVPPGQPAGTPLPLVLIFHSAGSSGLAAEAETAFTSYANRYGFIAVYPNSRGKFWQLSQPRDYDFARALLEQLDDTLCVDDSRVYATGVSNGASLVGRLGCLLSDRLTAIAPVAGDDGLFPGCQPTRDVSVLEIHGSTDESVPYDGSKRYGAGVWTFLGAWDQWDGCPTTPLVWQRLQPRVLYAAKPACAGGTTVAHVKLLREEHAWPSLTTVARGNTSGVVFSARQAIWEFFSAGTVLPPGPAAPAP
jgi:polyhydroxybutyrate depolymerase